MVFAAVSAQAIDPSRDAPALSPSELAARATRLLARREYSAHELRQRLTPLATAHHCEQLLHQLVAQDLQSDQRFAEMICRARVKAGYGASYIRQLLQQHQLTADIIERCLVEYQHDWAAVAARTRRCKFGDQPPANFPEWARQARFLQRRGFAVAEMGRYAGAGGADEAAGGLEHAIDDAMGNAIDSAMDSAMDNTPVDEQVHEVKVTAS